MSLTDKLLDLPVSIAGMSIEEANSVANDEWMGVDPKKGNPGSIMVFFDSEEDKLRFLAENPAIMLRRADRGAYDPERLSLFEAMAENVWKQDDSELPVPEEQQVWDELGMPHFEPIGRRTCLRVDCRSEEACIQFADDRGIRAAQTAHGGMYSGWWPGRRRADLRSIRFEPPDGEAIESAWEIVGVQGSLMPDVVPDKRVRKRRRRRVKSAPMPRYPIYIPSKGRWDFEKRLTSRALELDEVPYYLVVEPQEAELYESVVKSGKILTLPFSNQGTPAARNWIRKHAMESGAKRHWQLDDNMRAFRHWWRAWNAPCHGGVAMRACEDFTDCFKNVGLSGLTYTMFVTPKTRHPFYRNVHVYSATLVNHAGDYWWRTRLNDDTDLCLQYLAGGWCTVLVNAFMVDKMQTMKLTGGQTDLYQGNGRLAMARLLESVWPGIVQTKWRFNRPQHVVRWDRFTQPLEIEEGAKVEDYDLQLVVKREIRSDHLRRAVEEHQRGSA